MHECSKYGLKFLYWTKAAVILCCIYFELYCKMRLCSFKKMQSIKCWNEPKQSWFVCRCCRRCRHCLWITLLAAVLKIETSNFVDEVVHVELIWYWGEGDPQSWSIDQKCQIWQLELNISKYMKNNCTMILHSYLRLHNENRLPNTSNSVEYVWIFFLVRFWV